MSDFDVQETVKPRGLGRGLNALFDSEESVSVMDAPPPVESQPAPQPAASGPYAAQIEEAMVRHAEQVARGRQVIGTEQIRPSRFQPRTIFQQDALDELAASIKEYGILQPLLVRESEYPGIYDLIAGERRWRAAQYAQLHEVPVIVLDLDDLAAQKVALIENLQREDLDPIDEAKGYQVLLEEYGQTQEQLAEAVGKSRPHITNMMRLLSLPASIQGMLSLKEITVGHARALVGAHDPEAVVKQVVSKGLSVRQTEKLAAANRSDSAAFKPRPRGASSAEASNKDADTTALENDMTNALGMRVSIDSTDGKSGKLSIEFKSLDQLDELLHRLAHFPGARLSG